MFNFEKQIALPGDLVTSNPSFMRGSGTFANDDNETCSSVAGVVKQVNKLITVQALRARYIGEVGDLIIGRIIEVQVGQKRWRVETGARMDSILHLNSINLPSGQQRRKTAEDEMMMKQYYKEGDLIIAEVQSIFQDGSLSLHPRNFGQLGQGTLVKVPPSLIERRKTHFHNLPEAGVHIILANNGYVWVSPERPEDQVESGFIFSMEPVALYTRERIARMRNCLEILKVGKVPLNAKTCALCFDESKGYDPVKLLEQETINKVLSKFQAHATNLSRNSL